MMLVMSVMTVMLSMMQMMLMKIFKKEDDIDQGLPSSKKTNQLYHCNHLEK